MFETRRSQTCPIRVGGGKGLVKKRVLETPQNAHPGQDGKKPREPQHRTADHVETGKHSCTQNPAGISDVAPDHGTRASVLFI